jgi:hypothetical protein
MWSGVMLHVAASISGLPLCMEARVRLRWGVLVLRCGVMWWQCCFVFRFLFREAGGFHVGTPLLHSFVRFVTASSQTVFVSTDRSTVHLFIYLSLHLFTSLFTSPPLHLFNLRLFRRRTGVTLDVHRHCVMKLGWSLDDFEVGWKDSDKETVRIVGRSCVIVLRVLKMYRMYSV